MDLSTVSCAHLARSSFWENCRANATSVAPQVTYTESAISYSVSMSCVLGSRLCLNVRGMVWQDDDIMTGHNTTSIQPTVPIGFRSEHPPHPWHVVVTGHSKPDLTEYEMDELRTMRLD